MSVKQKVKATEDRGSLDLTRQLDESDMALNTLKKIIHNLQEQNKKLREENKQLKDDAKEMLLYP